MAKHIVIERPNGLVTIVRSEIEKASEEPLTEHEQIINELFDKIKKLNKPAVVGRSEQLVCDCSTCGTFDKCDCDNCLQYDRWRPKAN